MTAFSFLPMNRGSFQTVLSNGSGRGQAGDGERDADGGNKKIKIHHDLGVFLLDMGWAAGIVVVSFGKVAKGFI